VMVVEIVSGRCGHRRLLVGEICPDFQSWYPRPGFKRGQG
jgi:hypothetical protein